jgi:hypothetical protein
MPPEAEHHEIIARPVAGMQVDFWSETNGCWIPVCITHVNGETGAVRLDVRERMMDVQEWRKKLRPRRKPSQEQLDRARAVLCVEGRLEREAAAIFSKITSFSPVQPLEERAYDENGISLLPSDMCHDFDDVLVALSIEVDARMGSTGSLCALRHMAGAQRKDGFNLDCFAEALERIAHEVLKEFGQAMP